MQKFIYRAVGQDGQNVEAEVEAVSVPAASKLLQDRGLFPISIEAKGEGRQISLKTLQAKRIKPKDRVVFTRQLATLIKSGLTITKSLDLLVTQLQHPKLKDITRDIVNKVRGGTSLGDSLKDHPKVFGQMYVSIVEAGEASGTLDKSLLRLAEQEEKTYQVNSKIKSAFTYPVIVFAVLIIVSLLMVTLVLPQVGAMYDELKKPMPAMTQFLMGMSDFLRGYWYFTTPSALAAVGGIIYYMKSAAARPVIDKAKLNVPMFKDLIRKMYMARFGRTLSTLVNSGVPVLTSLEIVGRSMSNLYYEEATTRVSTRVKAGEPLSKPISDDPLFLPLMGQMLEVGEQTGGIGETLEKVANYYEEEVDQQISTIQTLIEPMTIVVLGLMVVFLIGAVLFPIYNLVSSIR